jgi:hypothetical protein
VTGSLLAMQFRVDFKSDERDAWYIAKELRMLSKVRRHQIRVLMNCMREYDALHDAAEDMAAHPDDDRPGP